MRPRLEDVADDVKVEIPKKSLPELKKRSPKLAVKTELTEVSKSKEIKNRLTEVENERNKTGTFGWS